MKHEAAGSLSNHTNSPFSIGFELVNSAHKSFAVGLVKLSREDSSTWTAFNVLLRYYTKTLQSEPETTAGPLPAGHMVLVESRHSDGEKHLFFFSFLLFSFLFFSELCTCRSALMRWLLWIALLSSAGLQQI